MDTSVPHACAHGHTRPPPDLTRASPHVCTQAPVQSHTQLWGEMVKAAQGGELHSSECEWRPWASHDRWGTAGRPALCCHKPRSPRPTCGPFFKAFKTWLEKFALGKNVRTEVRARVFP